MAAENEEKSQQKPKTPDRLRRLLMDRDRILPRVPDRDDQRLNLEEIFQQKINTFIDQEKNHLKEQKPQNPLKEQKPQNPPDEKAPSIDDICAKLQNKCNEVLRNKAQSPETDLQKALDEFHVDLKKAGLELTKQLDEKEIDQNPLLHKENLINHCGFEKAKFDIETAGLRPLGGRLQEDWTHRPHEKLLKRADLKYTEEDILDVKAGGKKKKAAFLPAAIYQREGKGESDLEEKKEEVASPLAVQIKADEDLQKKLKDDKERNDTLLEGDLRTLRRYLLAQEEHQQSAEVLNADAPEMYFSRSKEGAYSVTWKSGWFYESAEYWGPKYWLPFRFDRGEHAYLPLIQFVEQSQEVLFNPLSKTNPLVVNIEKALWDPRTQRDEIKITHSDMDNLEAFMKQAMAHTDGFKKYHVMIGQQTRDLLEKTMYKERQETHYFRQVARKLEAVGLSIAVVALGVGLAVPALVFDALSLVSHLLTRNTRFETTQSHLSRSNLEKSTERYGKVLEHHEARNALDDRIKKFLDQSPLGNPKNKLAPEPLPGLMAENKNDEVNNENIEQKGLNFGK